MSRVRVAGESPFWPVGQAVKTPPFHGGIPGSIPGRVTTYGRLAQLGERLPYKQDVGSSILSSSTKLKEQAVKLAPFFYIYDIII